jgi:uncharacterized protein DUF4838/glycosyl hydrolase family 67
VKKIIILFLLVTFSALGGNTFFDKKSTNWSIYIPESSGQVAQYAAEELRDTLKKISGADFKIIKTNRIPDSHAIVIGTLKNSKAVAANATKLKLAASKFDQLAIYSVGKNLYLAGNRPRAALYAVYRFLQNQLGVRWFWVDSDGEFTPKKSKWKLPQLAINETGGFRERDMTPVGYQSYAAMGPWASRNMLNCYGKRLAIRDKTGAIKQHIGHGHQVAVAKKLFAEHPEWFSLVNGKRIPEGYAGCWSNPEFTKYLVEKLTAIAKKSDAELACYFPADIMIRCECAKCTKNPDASSRWFQYYAKLIRKIHKKMPNLRFSGIAYMEYRDIPTSPIEELDYVKYCQSDRCYIHKFNDPNCKLNKKSLKELQKWMKKTPVGIYGYHFDLLRPRMYIPFWNMLADEIRTYKKFGNIIYIKTEFTLSHPGSTKREDRGHMLMRLPGYIYAQMLWNPDADVDAILKDWCKYVYGPAKGELLAYHRAMAAAWDSQKAHASYYDVPPNGIAKSFISDKLITLADKLFKKATAKIAKVTDEKKRKRYLKEIEFEKNVFNKWRKVRQLSQAEQVAICLSKNTSFKNVPTFPLVNKAKTKSSGTVAMSWTEDALHIQVNCLPGFKTRSGTGSTERDKTFGGKSDLVEIFINPNDGSEYLHFAVNPAGGIYDAKAWDVSWNPNWKRSVVKTATGWRVTIELPFKELGKIPKVGDQWSIVVNRYTSPFSGFPSPMFHNPSGGALIHFSNKNLPKHSLLWINNLDKRVPSFLSKLLVNGWSYLYCEGAKNVPIQLPKVNMIVLTATRWNDIPKALFTQRLLPMVKNGAVLLLEAYRAPLAKYFDDKSFRIDFDERNLCSPRRVHWIAPKFANAPNDMSKALNPPPPAIYIAKYPKKWKNLATQKRKDGSIHPFLLARPYGKGLIVVTKYNGGWPRTASKVVPLIDNILEYSCE